MVRQDAFLAFGKNVRYVAEIAHKILLGGLEQSDVIWKVLDYQAVSVMYVRGNTGDDPHTRSNPRTASPS